MTPPLIQMRRVRKTYREGVRTKTVLESVDLELGEGELVVLLGRSGSGKSTLLNLLSGIDLATSGEVRFDGADLGRMSEKGRTLLRRHQIGFVFQFFNLVPTLTVEENLLLPLELAGRPGADERRRALGLLEHMGLDDRRSSYPDVLSGGEQQRLAIARAMAHDPRLLLADEPTGNLDHETSLSVLEMLESTVRDAGKTLVMATHDPEVAQLADRVLRIQDGALEEDSPPTRGAEAPRTSTGLQRDRGRRRGHEHARTRGSAK